MDPDYRRPTPDELQGEEANLRRERLAEKYHITEQETTLLKARLRDAVSLLDTRPEPEGVVKTLDSIFTDDAREQELKKLYTDSVIAKVSESIRFFLPIEAQGELQELTNTISEQLEGHDRRFDSVDGVYRELKKYEPIFSKYGLSFEDLIQRFIDELRKYLNQR